MSVSRREDSQVVLGTIEAWLREEVDTSGQDGNRVLDDFEEMRGRLSLPLSDNKNWFGSKHRDHISRLELWWEEFEKGVEDDEAAALITFGALMEVSGMHRIRSNIQAASAGEYMQRRRNIAEIGAKKPVLGVFGTHLPGSITPLSEAQIGLYGLQVRKDTALTTADRMVAKAGERLQAKLDFDTPESETAQMLQKSANAWLKLAAASIIFSAKTRGGDLAKVPLRTPMTINRSQLYYPFAEAA